MQHLSRVLASCVVVLGLIGCTSLPSEFDYANGVGTTADLVMPYPVRIVSLNGNSVTLPPVLEFPYTATIPAGDTRLQFQYGEPWGQGDDNELVRGPIMEAAFAARAGGRYTVDFVRPDDVRFRDRAPEYLAGFSAWMLDEGGGRIDAVSTGSRGGVSIDFTGSLAGNKSAAASTTTVATTESVSVEPVSVEPVSVAPADDESSRLDSLKTLWLSADDDEKKAFMQWVVAPDS
ncbi:MAG: DUF2057 family protein [Pseudomonadota bacterium]